MLDISRIFKLALFAITALSIGLGPTHARELRFAPLPLEDKKIIHEQFQGIANYLSEKTENELKMVFFTQYEDIITAFSRDKIDLAYLGPLPYVLLKKRTKTEEPLVCFRDTLGDASYTCSLVVFEDSALELEQLKGVSIGLTQPYSTCGYLAVSKLLEKAEIKIDGNGNRFEYAGSHSKAALGVVRGQYDVAGVKSAIGKRYLQMGLKEIAVSEHFPGFTIVANTNTVTPEEIIELREALLALNPLISESDKVFTQRWGKQFRSGAVPPIQCNYQGVADALEGIPWPIPGSR